MDLQHCALLDLESGTYFPARNAYLLDWRALSDEEIDTFCEGNDSDRREIAERHGVDLETLPLL